MLRRKHPDTETSPGTLGQRFSAMLLDTGIILAAYVLAISAYYVLTGAELNAPGYEPPRAEEGLMSVWQSMLGILPAGLYLSVLPATRMRATPGMRFLHLHVAKPGECNDKTARTSPGFVRIFIWRVLAFAPVLLANYIILLGVAFETPLIHIGRLNLVPLCIILQALIFLPVFTSHRKLGIHDRLSGVAVCGRIPVRGQRGLAYYLPYCIRTGLALLAIIFLAFFGILNLFDAPLAPEVKRLEAHAPDPHTFERYHHFEQNKIIEAHIPDFYCAANAQHFRQNRNCPSHDKIHQLISRYETEIRRYKSVMLQQDGRADKKTTRQQRKPYYAKNTVALTDLFLARLVLRAHSNQPDAVFRQWRKLTQQWRKEILRPGPIGAKTYIYFHYNRVLAALPVLFNAMDKQPKAPQYTGLNMILSPITPGQLNIGKMMTYEYSLYKQHIKKARAFYFPFMHPNHIHNQFLRFPNLVEKLFEAPANSYMRKGNNLTKNYHIPASLLEQLYNPIGRKLADLALMNTIGPVHSVGMFHHNNAYKAMLRLYLKAYAQNIDHRQMQAFLNNQPENQRQVFGNTLIKWSKEKRALYYELENSQQLRRYLYI